MDAYALHLAMAALVGASFVAVSAYFMHRKTLTQLLEFTKAVERERGRDGAGDDEDDRPEPSERRRNHQNHRRRASSTAVYYRRASASLPDVSTMVAAVEREERQPNGPLSAEDRNLSIPAGLPRLHTLPEGMDLSDFSPEWERLWSFYASSCDYYWWMNAGSEFFHFSFAIGAICQEISSVGCNFWRAIVENVGFEFTLHTLCDDFAVWVYE